MATVRFSDNLKAEIRDNAREVYQKKINTVRNKKPKIKGDDIYNCIFNKQEQETVESLPDYWVNKIEEIEFNGFHNFPEPASDEDEKKQQQLTKNQRQLVKAHHGERLSLPLSKARVWVETRTDGSTDKLERATGYRKGYSDTTVDYQKPKWDWLKKPYGDWCGKIRKLEEERDAFVDDIETIMDNFNSLAPAVKEYPFLYDFVPREAKERAERKVEKRTSQQIVQSINVDKAKLTSIVALDKITRGTEDEE